MKRGDNMMKGATAAAITFWLAMCGAALGQTSREKGDWPCRQIKVPNIALAGVWTGPSIADLEAAARADAEISDLAARLGARRTPIETAEKLIADFAKGAGAKRKERLTLLFAAVFSRLDGERAEVISGLDRYGRGQLEAAAHVRDSTQALRDARDKAPGDVEKIKQLSDALQWEIRLYEERRKAVTFVCETPALIEQRLGALARAILGAME